MIIDKPKSYSSDVYSVYNPWGKSKTTIIVSENSALAWWRFISHRRQKYENTIFTSHCTPAKAFLRLANGKSYWTGPLIITWLFCLLDMCEPMNNQKTIITVFFISALVHKAFYIKKGLFRSFCNLQKTLRYFKKVKVQISALYSTVRSMKLSLTVVFLEICMLGRG